MEKTASRMEKGDGVSKPRSLPLLHSEYYTPTCLSEFAKDKENLTMNSPHSHPSHSPRVGVGNVEKVCCCKLGTCSTLGPFVVWSCLHCLEKMAAQGQSVCVAFLHYVMKPCPIYIFICSAFPPSASLCGLQQATLLNAGNQKNHS